MSLPRARRLAPLSLGLTAALTVAACGGSADATPTATAAAVADCDPAGTTITAAFAPQGQVAAEAARTALEAEYPGLTVELRPSSTSSYDELTQQVVADIAAGNRPDVTMVGLGQIRFWVDQYDPQPIDPDTLADTYDPRFLSIGEVDGEPYVAPFQVSVPVLYTNTTKAEAAGVTTVPETTSELLEAARQVQAETGGAPVQLPRDAIADWVAQAMIQSAGATFVTEDGQPGFDDEAGADGLAVYEELGADALQDPIAFADATTAFQTGDVTYLVSSPASAVAAQAAIGDSFDWTVTAMPIPDGGSAVLPAGGNGWMVLSDDACRSAFGRELIADMLTPEVIAESSRSYSYIPVDTQAAAELAADPAVETQVGYSWTYTGTPTAWGGWHGDATPRVNVFLQDAVQQLIGGDTVEAVLPATVQRIQSAVR